MTEKTPFTPYKIPYTETHLANAIRKVNEEADLPEETVEQLMKIHHDDPDGFDDAHIAHTEVCDALTLIACMCNVRPDPNPQRCPV